MFAAGDYIQAAASPELQFTVDFTIEMFVHTTSTSDQVIASSSIDSNTQILRLNQQNNTNTLSCYLNGTQVFNLVATGVSMANTWRHVAMTRQGSSTRLFVDGTVIATNTTYTGNFRMDVIGQLFFNGTPFDYQFGGYIDEVRVTNGFARYTANFTPPSAPYSS